MEQNLARCTHTQVELLAQASEIIRTARESTHMLMREGLIRPLPIDKGRP
jgi:hypothetical protein